MADDERKGIEDMMGDKFKRAYQMRFNPDDIDWKRGSDKMPAVAYLNWAVAWRAFKEIYPDGNYRLIEHDGDPLWNFNGYGMLKCAVSAEGIEYVETFPVMGFHNEAQKIEQIDSRDINDSAQRGFTKAIARFGIGLYIYEGKAPKNKQDFEQNVAQAPSPSAKPIYCSDCGKEIQPFGKFSANDIAKSSFEKFGRKLCTDCAKKEGDKIKKEGN